MSQHDPSRPQRSGEVDEAFEPWEQIRPVPVFVIALVFALVFWALLTYISEYRAQTRADAQHA
ncbi:MAG TPA: hypothetical protein VF861_00705, partial [Telluria sp.]